MKSFARKTGKGFTLLEMLVGLTLLGLLMALIYAALHFGIRAWDSTDERIAVASRERIMQSFLRRELSQVFAQRWRGAAESKIAFSGERQELRYVTALNLEAGLRDGGLQWGRLMLRDAPVSGSESPTAERGKSLLLVREPFDVAARDWSGLDQIEESKATVLATGLRDIDISYFGAESNTAEPQWQSAWSQATRLPLLVRLKAVAMDGHALPDLVIRLQLGEEAGCYDTNFQRECRGRPT